MPTPREQAVTFIQQGISVVINGKQYLSEADLPDDATIASALGDRVDLDAARATIEAEIKAREIQLATLNETLFKAKQPEPAPDNSTDAQRNRLANKSKVESPEAVK